METNTNALWRIEFRTNETDSKAPVIKLGYMLEAYWANGAHWLGLTFRRSLMPLEQDCVNFDTWHELREPEVFMRSLFDQSWKAAQVNQLGSLVTAAKFPVYSALHFSRQQAAIDTTEFKGQESFEVLLDHLVSQQPNLEPTLKAPVRKLQPKKPYVEPIPDEFEMMSIKRA